MVIGLRLPVKTPDLADQIDMMVAELIEAIAATVRPNLEQFQAALAVIPERNALSLINKAIAQNQKDIRATDAFCTDLREARV